MSDAPLNLDLRLLPDWLKEPAGVNPYANYEGETPKRPSRNSFSGKGSKPPGRSDRGEGRSSRNPQAGGRPPRHAGKEGGHSRDEAKRPAEGEARLRRQGGRPPHQQNRPPAEPEVVIPLQVDFLPEPNGIAALIQQIKSGHRAFPLYGMGRMFLNKPERHRVRVTSNAPAYPIYQIGENGPITLSRAHAEREAFRATREEFYEEETREVEAPKGNFTNVARCRISGVLLGPTNHHGYQPALRRLYDTRFSRRMGYPEFLRQIEVVNDPEVIEQWKKESSSVTVYRTRKEETPVEFKSLAEVEAHFKTHYLPTLLIGHKSVEISGEASRAVGDRRIRDAIREAWEKERAFPSQIVNGIKPHFVQAGLHIWKHRKRILFVSISRPLRFSANPESVSEQIRAVLAFIEAHPKCSKTDLSQNLLKPCENEEEQAKSKSALAADLHWLIGSGHVIEFHDGTLDLPLPPKEAAKPTAKGESAPGEEAEVSEADETAETAPNPENEEGTAAAEIEVAVNDQGSAESAAGLIEESLTEDSEKPEGDLLS